MPQLTHPDIPERIYWLARLRHKIEASHDTLRMLGLRLIPEMNVDDFLRKKVGSQAAIKMADDLQKYVAEHDECEVPSTNPKISRDLPTKTRDFIIKTLKERVLLIQAHINTLETEFSALSRVDADVSLDGQQKILKLLDIHFSSVHVDEVDDIIDDMDTTGFLNRFRQHYRYDGATDLSYYNPLFQFANWLGRQIIWNTKNDFGEIKRLWARMYLNKPNRRLSAKLFNPVRDVWAIFKIFWNVAKLPLTPIGRGVRLLSRVLDSAHQSLAQGQIKPYQMIEPYSTVIPGTTKLETITNPELSVGENFELRVISANMERFLKFVAIIAGKEVVTPAEDTYENVQAIKKYLSKLDGAKLPDVICLQEMFDPGAQQAIIEGLQNFFPYIRYDFGPRWTIFEMGAMNSGLMILSRHPILETSFHRFHNSLGDESLSNKGVAIVRINKQGRLVDIANTHTQAGSSLGSLKKFFMSRRRGAGTTSYRRSEQLRIITTLLKRAALRSSEGQLPVAQVLAGDLNDAYNTPDRFWGLSSGVSNHHKLGTIKYMGRAMCTKYLGVNFPINFMDVESRFHTRGIFFQNTAKTILAIECVNIAPQDEQPQWRARILTPKVKTELVELSEVEKVIHLEGYWLINGLKAPDKNANTAHFNLLFRLRNKPGEPTKTFACHWHENQWQVSYRGKFKKLDQFTFDAQADYEFVGYSGLETCFQTPFIYLNIEPLSYWENVQPIRQQLFRLARKYNPDTFDGSDVGREYRYQPKGLFFGEGGRRMLDRISVKILDPMLEIDQTSKVVDSQTFSGVAVHDPKADHLNPDHHMLESGIRIRHKAFSSVLAAAPASTLPSSHNGPALELEPQPPSLDSLVEHSVHCSLNDTLNQTSHLYMLALTGGAMAKKIYTGLTWLSEVSIQGKCYKDPIKVLEPLIDELVFLKEGLSVREAQWKQLRNEVEKLRNYLNQDQALFEKEAFLERKLARTRYDLLAELEQQYSEQTTKLNQLMGTLRSYHADSLLAFYEYKRYTDDLKSCRTGIQQLENNLIIALENPFVPDLSPLGRDIYSAVSKPINFDYLYESDLAFFEDKRVVQLAAERISRKWFYDRDYKRLLNLSIVLVNAEETLDKIELEAMEAYEYSQGLRKRELSSELTQGYHETIFELKEKIIRLKEFFENEIIKDYGIKDQDRKQVLITKARASFNQKQNACLKALDAEISRDKKRPRKNRIK